MRIWGKWLFAAAAPLILGGCLWGPGKFASDLALRKDRSFVFDYRGEIMLQLPNDKKSPEPWNDDMAVCHVDGSSKVEGVAVSVTLEAPHSVDEKGTQPNKKERPCTRAEVAGLKGEYQKQAAEKLADREKEADQAAKLFGLPGTDDASNRRFAANLMKHPGWRSVAYKGKGVFEVDYHFEGRLNQDFAFPLMPDSDLLIPFIIIRPRTDGSVKVTAPALTGGKGPFGVRAKMLDLPTSGNDGPPSRAEGRFTVTTDGEILTNNSEDGPVAATGGRKVQWDVGAHSDRIPEMLVRL